MIDQSTNVGLSRSQVAGEKLRRQMARQSMIGFSNGIDIPGKPVPNDETSGSYWDDAASEMKPISIIESRVADLHRLMMRSIEECVEEDDGRLMMFFPPGCAKSTYTDVVAPPYFMGKYPGHRWILGSYASTIAIKQSRKARSICRTEKYRSIWTEKPTLDKGAADEWAMSNGSEFMAAGLLAGITGNRANVLLLDDIVQNREAADSPTIREKTYSEYIETALSRLLPRGSMILIMTRWHEEDLAGLILPENYAGESGRILCRDGQTWNVICCPAEAERNDDPLGRKVGDFIWPDWFSKSGDPRDDKHWAPWRNNERARRTWGALYQQRPAPDQGIHFNRNHFKRYDPDAPRIMW